MEAHGADVAAQDGTGVATLQVDDPTVADLTFFAEGQTGETLAQQFENLSFSIV